MSDELRDEYDFDYREAKPNWIATGSGDYTAERERLFAGLSLDQLIAEIRRMVSGNGGQADVSP